MVQAGPLKAIVRRSGGSRTSDRANFARAGRQVPRQTMAGSDANDNLTVCARRVGLEQALSGRPRGFTLVEMMTVVAILAVLAGLTYAGISRIKGSAGRRSMP